VKLADFLKKNKPGDPPVGTVGVESDWLEVGTLQVTTGSLWAGDPYVCNGDDGCFVKVPAGPYVLMAKAMDFAGRKRVSRLRVFLESAGKLVLGKKVGEADIHDSSLRYCRCGRRDRRRPRAFCRVDHAACVRGLRRR